MDHGLARKVLTVLDIDEIDFGTWRRREPTWKARYTE
jgi:hypothetical protein